MSTSPGLIEVRVVRKHPEAEDICSLSLAPVSGTLPAFSAGSHIDIHLPGGKVRQYSLCNDPAQSDRYEIAVLRTPDSRGGSTAVHDAVKEGDVLSISAPRNHFMLATEARRHLLLAGGIGVTPLLCMAERLSVIDADFDLHYAARSEARTAFIQRMRSSAFGHRVQFHFDDGAADQRLDLPGLLAAPTPGTHLYVCGPRGFMEAVLTTARSQGWPEEQLHWEFFAGADPVATDSDGSFEVQIASSGQVIQVPADQTVVKALSCAGIEVMVSCEQGVCGTCLTRVLSGEIEHRDSYLTPEEQAANDQFTPCCSRAKSARIVLDL